MPQVIIVGKHLCRAQSADLPKNHKTENSAAIKRIVNIFRRNFLPVDVGDLVKVKGTGYVGIVTAYHKYMAGEYWDIAHRGLKLPMEGVASRARMILLEKGYIKNHADR